MLRVYSPSCQATSHSQPYLSRIIDCRSLCCLLSLFHSCYLTKVLHTQPDSAWHICEIIVKMTYAASDEAFQHFFSLSSLTCENKTTFSNTANCESLGWASGQITADQSSGVPPFALTVTLTFPRTPIHQWHWRCARGRVCQKEKYSLSHVLCDEILWLILTVDTVSNLYVIFEQKLLVE